MPNLINDSGYNGLGSVAQNYRRVSTGGSNYGTRRVQFYQIEVYGLTDAEVAKLDNYRAVNNTEIDIDQEPEREFRSATVVEAILRAVQVMGEVYIVGAHDVDQEEPDYNDLYLIVGVSGDTISSGWEMDQRDDPATHENYNNYLQSGTLADALDEYNVDDWDAYPVMIYGDHFSSTGAWAMPAPELKALRAATKAAREPARLARKPG